MDLEGMKVLKVVDRCRNKISPVHKTSNATPLPESKHEVVGNQTKDKASRGGSWWLMCKA